jgi:hypothetical protein
VPRVVASRFDKDFSQFSNVIYTPHKTKSKKIDARLGCPLGIFDVGGLERLDAQLRAGQIDSLSAPHRSALHDGTDDTVRLLFGNGESNRSIGKHNAVPHFYVVDERFVSGRKSVRFGRGFSTNEDHRRTGCALIHAAGNFPQSHFRTGKIGKNPHGYAEFFTDFANAVEPTLGLLLAPMCHIEPEDTDSRLDEFGKDFFGIAGRTNGRNDFRVGRTVAGKNKFF